MRRPLKLVLAVFGATLAIPAWAAAQSDVESGGGSASPPGSSRERATGEGSSDAPGAASETSTPAGGVTSSGDHGERPSGVSSAAGAPDEPGARGTSGAPRRVRSADGSIASGSDDTTAAVPRAGVVAPAAPHEDDGRDIDYLFIQAEGGLSYADLTALSSSGRLLPSLTGFRGTGWGGGVNVGFRSGFIAVAAHGFISRFDGDAMNQTSIGGVTMTTFSRQMFDLGQLMAEVQLRLHVPVIEPYLRVGFGYAWMGNFQLNSMYQLSTSDVHGWTGKVGAGLDVWLGRIFTIGAGVDVTLLNLRRGGVMTGTTCPSTDPTCVDLSHDGDVVGLLAHFHVQLGLHF